MMDFKGSQFEREIILWAVRWYVASPVKVLIFCDFAGLVLALAAVE